MTGNPSDGTEAERLAQLERMAPRLLLWAGTRLHGRARREVEDFVQDVLCRSLVLLPRFRGGNLDAWVFQIARNMLLEQLRRVRRAGRVQHAEGASSLEAGLDQRPASITTLTRRVAERDDVRAVLALVETLGDVDRDLVRLCGLEALPPREVGVQLGMSEEAVAKRWYRLRARLRDWFPGGD